MKGIVFAEFIEMVEEAFSPEVADRVIEGAELESGGVYTAVGTYDHHEILNLVEGLARETEIPAADLVRTFGKHMFGRFHEVHPNFFEGIDSAFAFLEKVENFIHVEVRKLYPDAELPAFTYEHPDPARFVMNYESSRPFADLAHGLILGCIEHYGEDISVDYQDLSGGQATSARFELTQASQAA